MRSIEDIGDLVCVRCGAGLEALQGQLRCVGCEQIFPQIMDIPVLLHRPNAALQANEAALEQARAEARELDRRHQWALADHASEGLAQRIDRWRRGTAANLELMQRYTAPISTYLGQHAPSDEVPTLLDFASSRDVGWTPSALLPYFHQDWCEGTGFDDVRRLVSAGVARGARGKVAVLGAGACGLAHALASDAPHVYAVDLCLPALLMARAVMRGESLTVSLERAGWRTSDIRGPKAPASNVTLIQANVNALPFADGSLSAVVTQYLLDLMENPFWLAAEIRRVLAPQGVWVNFSNPCPMPGETETLGRPELPEVRELLGSRGWTFLDAARHEFVLNDVRSLDPDADVRRQNVHFFVAQSQGKRSPEHNERRWMRDPAWWSCRVTHVPGADVKVLHPDRANDHDDAPTAMLSIRGQTVPVPTDVAASVGGLFQLLDSGSTLNDIAKQVEQSVGLSRPEFRELIHFLSEHYGLVRLTDEQR